MHLLIFPLSFQPSNTYKIKLVLFRLFVFLDYTLFSLILCPHFSLSRWRSRLPVFFFFSLVEGRFGISRAACFWPHHSFYLPVKLAQGSYLNKQQRARCVGSELSPSRALHPYTQSTARLGSLCSSATPLPSPAAPHSPPAAKTPLPRWPPYEMEVRGRGERRMDNHLCLVSIKCLLHLPTNTQQPLLCKCTN